MNDDNTLRQENFSYGMTDNWTDDVKEFVELCEQGILYDDLMRRLNIPARRRDSFKRLFFSQVFFGKIKTTGRVRELFARDFPTVYKAINDLKRKDYRQLAYLLQAHESKIMIDIICRRILAELPGTFIGTIHDSIMTTPDKAEEVKTIMVREFQRFGLEPNDQVGSILICCNCPVSRWSDFDDWLDQQSHLVSGCVRSHPQYFPNEQVL